uniref:Uncharacterized protein n=1 Tax=Tanacetum cinerariifolium TaxID=118510 RepID=A0A699HEE8_TANCI|nr:hypothetical protein [Tanacetum cinerariifolium]
MEMTGAEIQEEHYHDIRPTLQRLPFYCTPPADADVVIPNPTIKDLAVGTPSVKILAKAEASQKRKAYNSGATISHVAKCTRSTSNSTTRPSLFVDNSNDESDDDGDACVEIPLITPIRSAIAGALLLLLLKVPALEGKGIMVDDAAAPSVGSSQLRPSSGFVPSFRDVFEDAIHADFFSFSVGPYYSIYLKGGVVGNCKFTRAE